MFRKVLIANRGEIAVRVLRALRELRVASVAVHSEADRGALHVRLADEAVELGPAPSAQSYLAQDKVLEAAQRTGAEAIHPGYGFLSENAAFARRCERAGLVFVGPSSRAMARLGDKLRARALAKRLGVPLTPGSDGAVASAAEARKVARRIGYPLMIKASGGGGGLGMRVVRKAEEVGPALEAARAQAQAAFGVPDVFVERFHERPRHIEVQVLGVEGDALQLGERECSIQRRHQKLVEEAPSPALTAKQRVEVAEEALKLFRAAEYENAGTAEFLFVEDRFYFNEVNARLQVEHPVTEMVTGLDLVKAQLRVASGEEPGFAQRDVHVRGWAIECRVNAEDPLHGFAPSPGQVRAFSAPTGPGVRVDAGVEAGDAVPPTYDSLVAKLVVHGRDRAEAVQRMGRALAEFRIEGVATTLPLHRAIAADRAFRAGRLHTRFLEERRILEGLAKERERLLALRRDRVAALAAVLRAEPALLAQLARRDGEVLAPEPSAWRAAARAEALRRWPP